MKKLLPGIIAVIVIGLISFYGGLKLGESKNVQTNVLQGGNFGQMGGPQMMTQNGTTGTRRTGTQGGNFINGEILSADDKSITIKLADSGSKIVFYSDSTKVVKSTDASAAELTQGTNIMVNGTSNSDGSLTATNIQIRSADALNMQGQPPANL